MDIDKWTAEKCDVKLREYSGGGEYFAFGLDVDFYPEEYSYKWTMQDARCRELVEDFFKIELFYVDGELNIIARPAFNMNRELWGEGRSRKIASISCIEAIMKADDN